MSTTMFVETVLRKLAVKRLHTMRPRVHLQDQHWFLPRVNDATRGVHPEQPVPPDA